FMNVSIRAIVSRAFWYASGNLTAMADIMRRTIAFGLSAGVLALSAIATLDSRSEHERLIFALWVVTAVLLSPVAWLSYLVLMLISFAALIGASCERGIGRSALAMAAAAYALAEVVPAA